MHLMKTEKNQIEANLLLGDVTSLLLASFSRLSLVE